MIRKETGVLILVLALLVGLAWYSNQPNSLLKEKPTETATVTAARYLVELESSAVASFNLSSQDGGSIFLERGPGGVWIVKKPIEGIADQSRAEEGASQVTTIRILTTLESAPPTSATGLDYPGYTLDITTTDGTSIQFKIGAVTVTNTGYYVADGSGQIRVVGKTNIDTLIGLISNPPYAETPTPSPAPSETPTATPTSPATLTPTGTSKP